MVNGVTSGPASASKRMSYGDIHLSLLPSTALSLILGSDSLILNSELRTRWIGPGGRRGRGGVTGSNEEAIPGQPATWPQRPEARSLIMRSLLRAQIRRATIVELRLS